MLNTRAHPLRLVQPSVYIEYVRINCADCEIATPWVPVEEEDENVALDQCGLLWNTRTDRIPVKTGSIEELIEKEVNAEDISYLLALIARNDSQWETRGPILAKVAQRLIDAVIITREWWPITPTLEDAGRYRKLLSNGHRPENSDSPDSITFPHIVFSPSTSDYDFEDRVAAAVDALPDRERW